jgi:RHS repeat-associated protein
LPALLNCDLLRAETSDHLPRPRVLRRRLGHCGHNTRNRCQNHGCDLPRHSSSSRGRSDYGTRTKLPTAPRPGTNAGTYYLGGDAQGSVSWMVNAATLAVTRTRYYPYGQVRGTANAMPTDHGFVGQIEDDTTGLNYLNARYQDPLTGVFLSVDPLVAKTGEPYIYGGGNPSTLADPTGLCAQDDGTTGRRESCIRHRKAVPRGSGGPGSSGLGRPCGGGFVPRSCLPKLLNERYKKFIGLGDGQVDMKVDYLNVEPGEVDLCVADPLDCVLQTEDLKAIKNFTEESRVNTDDGDGTLGNGRRQVLLAALLTWQFGEERARTVLEAHENIRDGELLDGQDFGSLRMTDLINNEIGIALGNQFKDEWGAGGPAASYYAGWGYAGRVPASGFYTDEGLEAIEDAVLSNPSIVYFVMAG